MTISILASFLMRCELIDGFPMRHVGIWQQHYSNPIQVVKGSPGFSRLKPGLPFTAPRGLLYDKLGHLS